MVIISILATIPSFAGDRINVFVNGVSIQMKEPPAIINGRTLVPLRAIFESLGVLPVWDDISKTVTVNTETINMIMTIDSKIATVNNKLVPLDAPVTLVDGSTMVPARFIAETLGGKVEWEEATKTVVITTSTMVNSNTSPTQETLIYENGDRYVGSVVNGKANGYGTLTTVDGDKYIGEFMNDLMNGQGESFISDEEKHVGEFKNGKADGYGVVTYASIGVKYIGEFKDGFIHGHGEITYIDGNRYVGEFKEGGFSGQGTYYYNDGSVYVGGFEAGWYHGQGTYTLPNGDVQSGIWEFGVLQLSN